jgi:transposase
MCEEHELKYIGSQIRQGVVNTIRCAVSSLAKYKASGVKVGRLKFKSHLGCLNLQQYGSTHLLKPGKIRIQGVGWVKIHGLDQLPNIEEVEFANAKLLNTPKGYYVAVTTYTNKKLEEPKQYLPEIGIDMGCSTSITVSDERTMNVRVEEPVRLKRLQRKFARQTLNHTRRTNNSSKTLKQIKRIYQSITNRKNDIANKIVSCLLKHERVYMQDEMLAKWQKNGHGRAVQHSVLGRVKSKLKQSPRVIVLDKSVATTKTCYCGNYVNVGKFEKTFHCPKCGCTEPRDLHGARMMPFLGKKPEVKKTVGPGWSEFTPADMESLRLIAKPSATSVA